MNLKRTIAFTAALAAAVSFAQEEEEEEVAETSEETVAAAPAKPAATANTRIYFTLPVCSNIKGTAEVLKPGAKEWTKLEEGRFYPLGCSFRAGKDSTLTMAFGKDALVTAGANSSFTTRAQPIGTPSRTIVPTGGEITANLPVATPAGLFVITTSGFTVRNCAGESQVVYTETGDGSDAFVKCVTGTMSVEGRHYTIPLMRAADAFRVRTSHDCLESIIYGKSGDYVMRLDKGHVTRPVVQDDGTSKDVVTPATLDWHLSVGTYVQINRAVPAIGERMSVSVMTFDPAGTMKNNFAFSEGRGEVNTGELIPQESDDSVKHGDAESTTDSAADVEDDEVEEAASEEAGSSDSEDEESSDEDSSSDDSDDDDDDF